MSIVIDHQRNDLLIKPKLTLMFFKCKDTIRRYIARQGLQIIFLFFLRPEDFITIHIKDDSPI